MADAHQVWWRPGGRSPFALDPAKPCGPQIASALGQAGLMRVFALICLPRFKLFEKTALVWVRGLQA
jgi:hypothetical protein